MSSKPAILPHISLLTPNGVWLEGQILAIRDSYTYLPEKDTIWKNINRLWRFYRAKLIQQHSLELRYEDIKIPILTNNTGCFQLEIPVSPHKFRQEKLVYHLNGSRTPIAKLCEQDIYDYQFFKKGVISDIDDTVLISHATKPLQKARHLLFRSILKRKEVLQASQLYQELHAHGNRFFYVSNSEMNLFYPLRVFLHHKSFPNGPIYLKPFKKLNQTFRRPSVELRISYKLERIRFLLSAFPQKQFLLIGDGGQSDFMIYHEIATKHPNQIAGVYIRHLDPMAKKLAEETPENNELLERQIPVFHFEHYEELHQHLQNTKVLSFFDQQQSG